VAGVDGDDGGGREARGPDGSRRQRWSDRQDDGDRGAGKDVEKTSPAHGYVTLAGV
jgi:hypothetical protein